MVNILIPIFNLGGGCLLLVILRMAGVVDCILLLLGKGVIVNQHSSQSILLSFFHSYCRSLQTPLTLNKISTFYFCFIPSPLSNVIKNKWYWCSLLLYVYTFQMWAHGVDRNSTYKWYTQSIRFVLPITSTNQTQNEAGGLFLDYPFYCSRDTSINVIQAF